MFLRANRSYWDVGMVQDVYEQMPYNKIWYLPSPVLRQLKRRLGKAVQASLETDFAQVDTTGVLVEGSDIIEAVEALMVPKPDFVQADDVSSDVSADINSMSDIFSVDEEDLVQISTEPKFADVDMSVTDSVDSIVSSDVTAEDVLSAIDAVQGFTELNILVSDVVVTTAEPLDGVVVATDIVAVTEVIALSGEDLPIAVSFLDADAATRQDLLNRLRKSTVSKACFAYYALTDDEFCIEMIRLHRLGKSVQVIIDKEWTRSCTTGRKCVLELVVAGISVYHSLHLMHYKLLTIWDEDSAFAVGGSANLTKAAWTRNDEFIFHVEGHGGTRTIRHTSAEMCPYDSRGSFSDETLVEREPIFQRALTRIAGHRFSYGRAVVVAFDCSTFTVVRSD
ncbi:hypothetical protein AM587_10000960 [Phytophthora nicotianae]|uniref:Mitochondrial cardiolipin hydrolase n=1 Tax=Phytophthora nicotianae TaxID=4792 RepID=A0A0W8BM46_PHYNI|nr:hypothetical protein AM587_10000960 [Phytophthora nicotianae]